MSLDLKQTRDQNLNGSLENGFIFAISRQKIHSIHHSAVKFFNFCENVNAPLSYRTLLSFVPSRDSFSPVLFREVFFRGAEGAYC